MTNHQNQLQRYLSDKEIAEKFSVSRATVWRWAKQKENKFPAPIKLGPGCTRWRLADVVEWEKLREVA